MSGAALRATSSAAGASPAMDLAATARRLGVATLAGPALLRAARSLLLVRLPEGSEVPLLRVEVAGGRSAVALPATAASLARLQALLARKPESAAAIRLVDPDALAAAVALVRRSQARRAEEKGAPTDDRPGGPPRPLSRLVAGPLIERALAALSRGTRGLDARRSLTGEQAGTLAVTAVAVAGGLLAAPLVLLPLVAVAVSVVLMALAAMRIAATGFAAARRFAPPRRSLADADLPAYTVLVPLLREARVVPRLIAGLRALDYPADRLDVKLLVEVRDTETRAALERHAAGTAFEIVIVSEVGPPTKPKALNVGLVYARGDLVTVYDAEDRPDTDQLRTVAEVFAAASAHLGCVQARLAVDHAADGWITAMFALEYAMLFDRLNPWLAGCRLPFLLGGTSNHFRRTALLAVGGWDAWNVTEDADLAVRLARRGFDTSVVASTTWEEAPLTLATWLRQRTRWYKGWIQTWLVHARDVGGLIRSAGVAAFLALQLQLLGALVSAAAHPAFCLLVAGYVTGLLDLGGDGSFASDLWIAAAGVSLAVGYGAAAALALAAARDRVLGRAWPLLLTLPVYWLLLAVALGAAVRDLVRRPHHWEKTEHGLARRPPVARRRPSA